MEKAKEVNKMDTTEKPFDIEDIRLKREIPMPKEVTFNIEDIRLNDEMFKKLMAKAAKVEGSLNENGYALYSRGENVCINVHNKCELLLNSEKALTLAIRLIVEVVAEAKKVSAE